MSGAQNITQHINWYKSQLSEYGQKVYQILIDLRRTEQDANGAGKSCVMRSNTQFTQNKKVLSFRDPSSYPPLNPLEYLTSFEDSSNNDLSRPNFENVLLEKDNESTTFSRNDLIKPMAPIESSSKNKVVANKSVSDENVLRLDENLSQKSNENHNINWSDMFDTELLRDTTKENDKDNTEIEQILTKACIDMATTKKDVKPKKTKKRNDTDKINAQRGIKHKTRKEKYTKAVKHWLNDIDSDNLTALEKGKNEAQVFIEDKVPKPKVVQTQLANKDGIMKYKKPLADLKVSKEISEKAAEREDGINIDIQKPIKEKKNKSKFVAPIKSQVPVKDIAYKIIALNEENVNDHINLANFTDSLEIVMVLVYRNGYSQLNSTYSEDTCVPSGVLVLVDDQFFHIPSFDLNVKNVIAHVVENCSITCFDGKSILIYLSQFVDTKASSVIDVKIGGALLDPDNLPDNFADIQKLLGYIPSFTIATDCPLQKAAWYTGLLKECATKLTLLLKENSLWDCFFHIEMPLVPIIADMENQGINIDEEALKSMEQVLVEKMKLAEAECYKAAGRPFQINSPLQVRSILYDELQLDTKSNVKIKGTLATGAKSTSEAALRSLTAAHPLPRRILQYRHLHKAHATFLAGIAHHVKDGVIRPTWTQIAAATGRMACSNPNLQAIPKAPFKLNLFDEPECERVWLRRVYVSGRGGALVAADFRHAECRVLALAAHRPPHAPGDLFTNLAAQWLQKDEKSVSPEDRERTKRIVYASLYGAGTNKLMDILEVDRRQALEVTASFHRTFPYLKSFEQRVETQCVRGELRTAGGRRGGRPGHALNFLVQGTAADLCKLSMVASVMGLRRALPVGAARLVLQIHDELLWDVDSTHLHTAAAVIKEAMESSGSRLGLAGRMPVSLAAGRSWADLDPLTFN